jgi:hypothetical protein
MPKWEKKFVLNRMALALAPATIPS